MKWHKSMFIKVIIILLLFIIPLTAIYTFSYYKSLEIIESELINRNSNRLSIVRNQIDSNFENLSILLLTLSGQSSIDELKHINMFSEYYQFAIKREILDQLYFHRGISSWTADFAVYAPFQGVSLKTDDGPDEDIKIAAGWELRNDENRSTAYFIKHLTQPIYIDNSEHTPDLILEVKFPVHNIEKYLEQLKLDRFSNPFMYNLKTKKVISFSTDQPLTKEIMKQIPKHLEEDIGNNTIIFNDKKYLLSYMKLQNQGWVVVDYTLLQDVLQPLTKTRNLFYTFVVLLLLLTLLATYLLYRHVQYPIRGMLDAIQQIKKGNYSVRIRPNGSYEFQFMVDSFNEMTQQLQTLIEKVYKEKIRYQEIHLKQLQFQINPHFLYNCLFIIKNMAKLNQNKGIEAMSLHLGNYYRYMTRLDNKNVTIREELEFVKNYLDIHAIRLQRLAYEINIPDDMLTLLIPRLLIQPIVENAFEHGINSSLDSGKVRITGIRNNDKNEIIIEDNGKGLTDEEIEELEAKISIPMGRESGHGVWNVHQRLKFHFGEDAGLSFAPSSLGGLKVIIRWR